MFYVSTLASVRTCVCSLTFFFVYMEVQTRNRPPEESRVVLGNPRIAVARGTWHRFYVRRWSYLPTKKKTGISPGKDSEGTSMLEGLLRARTSCLILGSVTPLKFSVEGKQDPREAIMAPLVLSTPCGNPGWALPASEGQENCDHLPKSKYAT